MNKLLLTFGILVVGLSLTLGLQHGASVAMQGARDARQAWLTQTQLLAQAQAEHAALTLRIQECREEVTRLRTAPLPASADLWQLCTNGAQLSPAQSEQLLAELGFSWRQQPDYVVVSKESLKKISLNGLEGTNLTEAASQVLALTQEERAALETTAKELNTEYEAWAKANVRREEPSGEVLAKYSLSTDASFSQSLSNRFMAAVFGTLGPERGELLASYAYNWMTGLGMFGGQPATMTITRYGGDTSHLNVQIGQAGNLMSTEVSPYQPFPAAFRPIFPGGWADLAQREGFDLPQQFRTK